MNPEVAEAVDALRRAFDPSGVLVRGDGQGGAYVIVESVDLGETFIPPLTWMGGHIPALYPSADIYPVFIDGAVTRSGGKAFEPPVTAGHRFEGRSALQVSRRNNQIHLSPQTAVAKFAKVIDFLKRLP